MSQCNWANCLAVADNTERSCLLRSLQRAGAMVNTVNLSTLELPESLAAKVEERIKVETKHIDNFRKVDTFLMCILEAMRRMDTDMHRSCLLL